MNLNKVKKVILMLQKFEDILKSKKNRTIDEDEIDGIPEYYLIRQLKKNKKKKMIMRFKVNIEENNLIK